MAHGSPALAHKLDKYRTMCECFLVLFIPAHREQPATCGIILLGDSMVPHPGHENGFLGHSPVLSLDAS